VLLRPSAAKRRSAGPWVGLAISVELMAAAVFLQLQPQYKTPTAVGTVPVATNQVSAAARHGAVSTRRTGRAPVPRAGRLVGRQGRRVVAATSTEGFVPARLEIPLSGVSAQIVKEAVGRHGALEIPSNPRVVGWWGGGGRPGATAGTALVAGHIDTRREGPGAFFRLDSIRPGELIYVRTLNGPVVRYRMVARAVYRKNALPADLFTRKGRRRLALVTCGGPFDSSTGSYRDNVVVYALPT
jgi:hypothetical protein